MKTLKTHKCFGGTVEFWEHDSRETRTSMKFSTYRPPGYDGRGALVWLSGLDCTDENFMAKAGAFQALNDAGLMIVCPDTSPRGLPGENDTPNFRASAGFYVDATVPELRTHYRMASYVANELYDLVKTTFKARALSLFGHSMGGHGALVLGLREPEKFRSLSAFAPIVNPSEAPWGVKALTGYLGEDRRAWAAWDACALVRSGAQHPVEILVDQGLDDPFLKTQLWPERFVEACASSGQKLRMREQGGYNHGYYFIASFVRDHIEFHAKHLLG